METLFPTSRPGVAGSLIFGTVYVPSMMTACFANLSEYLVPKSACTRGSAAWQVPGARPYQEPLPGPLVESLPEVGAQ